MIDSHTHTAYSKHARGSVDELAAAAYRRGVTVLTITDHAPFTVDATNRLLESELDAYFRDIERARKHYAGRMTILAGLECDFMPDCVDQVQRLISPWPLDFVIGAIHYVPLGTELVKVWDLPRLHESAVLNAYFTSLRELVTSELFDAVAHVDNLLRGVPESVVVERMAPLLPLFACHGVSYELNASGARKSVYCPVTGIESAPGDASYPSRRTVASLHEFGATFTIGSDAHDPVDTGVGIIALLDELQDTGLREICYYVRRRRIGVPVAGLVGQAHARSGGAP
ncbi:histidinol phosphate phosphatase [Massilia sp. Root351]|jgi:histidinol-phosphatase (PHP family)|uniref:histidinol-phosphatase HisJ family protein n=1 Tax=Massilia sp. Root351 TaxID=1736522 RepID=UPI00070E43BB|nr:histidinol-phosphatase HisJ family protein [Massilia sp. Root351]KQV83924.1 histidinol phosphate phosphatase [Massilia sp. Root351]